METIIALLFVATTANFDLPPKLLSSLCYVESTHNIKAVHLDDGGTNSLGICQVKISTARWMGFHGDEKDLMDPETNIYYAGKYLSHQLARYHGNTTSAIIAYNMGSAKGLTQTEYSAKVNKQWRGKHK